VKCFPPRMKNKARQVFLYILFFSDVNDSPFDDLGRRSIHDACMDGVEFITGW
jgi:hypothetical protein